MHSMRLLIMSWFFLAGMIGSGLVGPNRMAIREQYGLSETAFGASMAVIQVLSSFAVLMLSHRLARLRPINILTGGLALVMTGFLTISLTSSAVGLALGWVLATAGTTMGMITNNISMDLWPHNPRRGIVLLHSYNAGGKVIGPLVAALFLGLTYRMSFTAMGAVTLVLLVGALILRKRTAALSVSEPEAHDPADSRAAFRNARFLAFMAMIGLIAGGEIAFATLLPTFLVKQREMSSEVATILLSVHLMGLTIGRFSSAYFADKLSHNQVIGICLAAGLFVFPALTAVNIITISVSLLVLGVMFSSTWPSYYAFAVERLPRFRHMMPYGSAMGCFLMASLCVVVSSVIADHNLVMAMYFGPGVLWAFGLMHVIGNARYAGSLARAD